MTLKFGVCPGKLVLATSAAYIWSISVSLVDCRRGSGGTDAYTNDLLWLERVERVKLGQHIWNGRFIAQAQPELCFELKRGFNLLNG